MWHVDYSYEETKDTRVKSLKYLASILGSLLEKMHYETNMKVLRQASAHLYKESPNSASQWV